MIGANCSSSTPCNARFGSQVFSIASGATATTKSGSANETAYIYVTAAGVLMVATNANTVTCAGCTAVTGVTSFPANVIPISEWQMSAGSWASGGGTDLRAFQSAKVMSGGTGIIITEAPGQSTLAVDNGVIPTYLMNTATLTFPAIATGTCAADQTITVTGANPGDAVAPGWPALPTGILGLMTVSSANTVTVRLCNLSGSSVTPAAATYRATIVRNY